METKRASAVNGLDKTYKKNDGIETTLDEMETFYYIVKVILSQKVQLKRIHHPTPNHTLGFCLTTTTASPTFDSTFRTRENSLSLLSEGKLNRNTIWKTWTKYATELLAIVNLYSNK
ncbi:MAG: hypothetical protein GX466_02580 [Candidatus Cloacimonetes bacterium]|nr:hypothetical protein [Candidatus Cloacimonadota bacterium]